MNRATGTFRLADAPAPRMFAEQFTASSPVAYSVTGLPGRIARPSRTIARQYPGTG